MKTKKDLVGQKVKNIFVVTQVLGEGSFGRVYGATDTRNGDSVAIKVMDFAQLSKEPKHLELLENEIKVLKDCKSQNVIRYIDDFMIDDHIFIITEFCNGGDLENYLRKKGGKLTEDEAVQFVKQILNGFKGLHEVQAMHRDFKLANILLHNGFVKIADLGFVKPMNGNQLAFTCLGTALTMAPEVLRQEEYGMGADLWSIGVVFYQMICGGYPYFGRTENELKYLIATKRPDFSGVNVSKQCMDFIERCLTENAKKRITWKEVYDHPLFHKKEIPLIYGIKSRVVIKDNQNFYQKQQLEISNRNQPRGNQIKKIESQNIQAFDKLNFEKIIQETNQKKQREKHFNQYEKSYLNKRNSIMFIFKFVTPYTNTFIKFKANHGITLFIAAKKAYIDMKSLIEAVKKQKNIFELRKYWLEFIKSPAYSEITKQLEEDLEMLQAQALSYQSDIEIQNKEIEAENDIDKVVSKNWEALVKDIVSQYWFMLAEPIRNRVPKEEGEKKNREILVKVLTALEFYTENKDLDAEKFEKETKNCRLQEAETKIKEKSDKIFLY